MRLSIWKICSALAVGALSIVSPVYGEPARDIGPEAIQELKITPEQQEKIRVRAAELRLKVEESRKSYQELSRQFSSLKSTADLPDGTLKDATTALGKAFGEMQYAEIKWDRGNSIILMTELTLEQQRQMPRIGARPRSLINVILKQSQ